MENQLFENDVVRLQRAPHMPYAPQPRYVVVGKIQRDEISDGAKYLLMKLGDGHRRVASADQVVERLGAIDELPHLKALCQTWRTIRACSGG